METPAGVDETSGSDPIAGSASGSAVLDGTAALRAGEAAISILASIERSEADAIVRLVAFDEANLSVFLGYASPVRYLEVEAGMSRADAVRIHGLVRHCRQFPLTAKALEAGQVTVPYVEVLAKVARGLSPEYERDEHELLGLVDDRDVSTFERALQNWHHRNDDGIDDCERRFEQRSLLMQRAFDGSGNGSFSLDAIGMDILEAALETPPDPADSVAPIRSLRQRRADSLIEMADAFLNGSTLHGSEPSGATSGTKTTVDVVIDLASLEGWDPLSVGSIRAELASGAPIPKPIVEQLLCDASYRRLITDGDSVVLDYGTATPDIPPALRRAVQRRDTHCQFQGCDRPHHWCDVHHLVPRSREGPTSERNLALVCRFHHSLIHQAGWQLTRDPTTGQLHTTSP